MKNLRTLNLEFTQVSDAGLEKLDELKGLEHLMVSNSRVSETGIQRFLETHPGCRVTWNGRSFGGKK